MQNKTADHQNLDASHNFRHNTPQPVELFEENMSITVNKNSSITPSRSLWRLVKILFDFIRGYLTFRHLGPTITVYGSARFEPEHPYYKLAVEVGTRLAKEGISVMTGGGPGIMEAANRGAFEAGGQSYGCSIILPREHRNLYVTKQMRFRYFFARKYMLTRFSMGFIALPGGYGTMDEIFEMVTLIKTNKIRGYPIVLLGKTFWEPLVNYLETTFVANQTIDREELECLYLCDSIDDAMRYIHETLEKID
jgi:uncharacterized protein (TIGR00730 family)